MQTLDAAFYNIRKVQTINQYFSSFPMCSWNFQERMCSFNSIVFWKHYNTLCAPYNQLTSPMGVQKWFLQTVQNPSLFSNHFLNQPKSQTGQYGSTSDASCQFCPNLCLNAPYLTVAFKGISIDIVTLVNRAMRSKCALMDYTDPENPDNIFLQQ